ncbi:MULTISPECIES: hypothetical protein [Pirellulaceae]|nr:MULTISPECIES: hypothetical protein [Pirellulaceae]
MHESTRRLLCRVAFLLGCVVPTICTLSWITYRQSSWSVAAVEDQLSETIGLKCHISKYYNPKPTKWVFEDVRLERAGSDAVVFPTLKAELVDNTWQLSADEVEVDWASRHRLWETLQEGVLLKRTDGKRLQLNVAHVRFREEVLPSLQKLEVKHDPEQQPALSSSLLVGDSLAAPPLMASVDTSNPQHWQVQLATTEQPIPTHPLRAAMPQLAGLGIDANFMGQITFELNHASTNVEMAGVFRQIDLQSALATNYQHGAGGADLYVTRLVVRNDNILEAFGGILSRNGQLSRRLLDRAAQHLNVQVVPPSRHQDLIAYHEMAIGFNFDRGSMTLTGLCDNMPPGTMLAGLEHPLVYESPVNILPATNLISVFFDNDSPTIPASQPSVDWGRWLTAPMIADRPSGSMPR